MISPDRPPCRHCLRKPASFRKRGLCWSCYFTPGIRQLHPSWSKYASRHVGEGAAGLPEPTHALPGSPEKVEVLCARVEAGLALWHPADERPKI